MPVVVIKIVRYFVLDETPPTCQINRSVALRADTVVLRPIFYGNMAASMSAARAGRAFTGTILFKPFRVMCHSREIAKTATASCPWSLNQVYPRSRQWGCWFPTHQSLWSMKYGGTLRFLWLVRNVGASNLSCSTRWQSLHRYDCCGSTTLEQSISPA